MEYIDNISASNYLRGMKEVRPALKEKKSNKIFGFIWLCAGIILPVLVMTGVIGDGIDFFIIMCSIFMIVAGIIYLATANMQIRYYDAFVKKLEEDINNVNLMTKKIIVSTTGVDMMGGKFDREKRQAIGSKFSSMYIRDMRNKIYRYNGVVLEFSPFSRGMELEVSYYTNTNVIASVQILNNNVFE